VAGGWWCCVCALIRCWWVAVFKVLKVKVKVNVKVNTEMGPTRFPRGTARVSAVGPVVRGGCRLGTGAVPSPSAAASSLRVKHDAREVNPDPLRMAVGLRFRMVGVDIPDAVL
jgi:hypothetical protein